MKYTKFFTIYTTILTLLFLSACGGYKKVDQRTMPDTAKERARKNIEEGKGISIGKMMKRGGKV